MEAEHAHPLGDVVVETRHEPAVSQREEVLRREEAERRAHTGLRDTFGAERLCCVLDDRQPELRELRKWRDAAEEVHRHQRLRARGHACGDILGIEVQGLRVDVGEDGGCAGSRDRLGRRVEREGGADHLVATSDPERLEREDERVRSVRHADRVRNTQESCGLVLEGLDLGAEDESPRVENRREPLLELFDERRVLRLRVHEWDRLSHAGESSSGEVAFRFVRRPANPRRFDHGAA